jgi:hypothetical protein
MPPSHSVGASRDNNTGGRLLRHGHPLSVRVACPGVPQGPFRVLGGVVKVLRFKWAVWRWPQWLSAGRLPRRAGKWTPRPGLRGT